MKTFKIYIITGLSGSGKSTAIAAFEDAGFYCVDNMPVVLLPQFLALPIEEASQMAGLAFVMDIREKSFLTQYSAVLESLQKKGFRFEILFLEADEEILIQRYSQTRRYHPLACGRRLKDGIRAEKGQLKDLRKAASKVINTSHLNVHKLKAVIFEFLRKDRKLAPMRINVLSFGFKYGIPVDVDLIIDVRFLANPYFVPELKSLDGKCKAIRDYVFNDTRSTTFLTKYLDLLDYLIPLYEEEGKAYLTIAVGCTGGRHRSVVIAEAIFKHLNKIGQEIDTAHRDIGR